MAGCFFMSTVLCRMLSLSGMERRWWSLSLLEPYCEMQVGTPPPPPQQKGHSAPCFLFSPSDGVGCAGAVVWAEGWHRAMGDSHISSHACVPRVSGAAPALCCQGLSGLLGLTLLKPLKVAEKRSWIRGQQAGSRTIKQLRNKAALAHITVLPRGRSCYTPDF